MIHLPRAELMTFDGDPLQYWVFMGAFENAVEKNAIDSASKLLRLLQYCTGKANPVIQCCLTMEPDEGYAKAQQLLKQRFGSSYVIAEAWIKKVTQGSSMRPNDREGLQDFSDYLQNCRASLQTTGHVQELNSQSTLVKIIARLPAYLQNRWKKQAMQIRRQHDRSPNINDIARFVQDAAEEANDPVYGVMSEPPKSAEKNRSGKRQGKGSSYSVSAFDSQQPHVIPASEKAQPSRRVCPKCNGIIHFLAAISLRA